MDLDGFFHFHRLERLAVEQKLVDELAAAPQQVICLAGSLAEGLGNPRSDLDVYIVADADPAGLLTFGSISMIVMEPIVADVEVIGEARIAELLTRLGGLPPDEARDARQSASSFSEGELKLLHNLRIGIPISGTEPFAEVTKSVDSRSLSRILLDRAVAWMGLLHIDTMGFIEASDEHSARTVLRAFRAHLAGALLAGLGATNPGVKWQVRLLAAERLRRPRLRLPGGLCLAEAIDRWEALDSSIGTAPPHVSLRSLLSLSYAIVPWAQERFLTGVPLDSDTAGYGPMPRLPKNPGEGLPPLRLDCQIRRDARGIWISRLSSPEQVYINSIAHELLMHFDGDTSVTIATARLKQICPAAPAEIERSLADFQMMLADRALI